MIRFLDWIPPLSLMCALSAVYIGLKRKHLMCRLEPPLQYLLSFNVMTVLYLIFMPIENLNRGVIGEGISCLIASLLGSTPVTGYSINAGIISITGIAAAASSLP